ncbi:hypothetical protein [Planktotalea sp.]|uniref:hypothetical protein n=1 Tax=Planktotalea sp. TaxID=2029877 RepID=UPI003D6ACE9B
MAFSAKKRFTYDQAAKYLKHQKEPLEIPDRYYPRFITFEDIERPETVQLIDPFDLAASFGDGYSIEKVTIFVTRENVTDGIVGQALNCIEQKVICVPTNLDLPYNHPLGFISNRAFKGTHL